jgi:hypothetical protein
MNESELEELLQRAIDPYVPVELFYAVLDRIGQPPAAAPGPAGLEPPLYPAPLPYPEPGYGADELDVVPLPDATMLMEQVEQLEAAMAGD